MSQETAINIKTVSVIGLGYIGLPTATFFAEYGKKVIGIDIDESLVKTINDGQIKIAEPMLDKMVHRVVKQGYLKATLHPENADAFIIAVPTPLNDNHEPDLSCVEAAILSIAPVLKKGNLIILESTLPVGGTEWIADRLAFARPDLSFPQQNGEDSDICIAYCPERVLPGHIMRELIENDRIIGGMTNKCSKVAHSLYKTFVKGECFSTSVRTAEMCKLTENSFRDVNIAFANELSIICDKLNINVFELIKLTNSHPRVNILQPGPGVGGHCIAVDPWFIVNKTPKEARLVHLARQINDEKPYWVIEKVKAAIKTFMDQNLSASPVVACFGLAFKPDIDDIRESPAITITEYLANNCDCEVIAVEPNISNIPAVLCDTNIKFLSCEEAIAQADIIVLLVDHTIFKQIDKDLFKNKVVVDTKGIWK